MRERPSRDVRRMVHAGTSATELTAVVTAVAFLAAILAADSGSWAATS